MMELSQVAFKSRMNLLKKTIYACHMQLKDASDKGKSALSDDDIKAIAGICYATYKDDAGNKCVEFMREDSVKRLCEGIVAEGVDNVGKLITDGSIDRLFDNCISLGPDYVSQIGKNDPIARLIGAAGN